MENCNHEDIDNNICTSCGLHVGENINMCIPMKGETHTHIYKPRGDVLSNLPVSKDCLDWMIENHSREILSKKKKSRNRLIFAYIYIYHLLNRKTFNIKHVINHLDLREKDVNMAMRIVSGIKNRDLLQKHAPIVVFSPKIYLSSFCKKASVNEEEVGKLLDLVLEKDPSILEEDPEKVVAGLIRYYVELNGNLFDGSRLGFAPVITKEYKNLIEKILD